MSGQLVKLDKSEGGQFPRPKIILYAKIKGNVTFEIENVSSNDPLRFIQVKLGYLMTHFLSQRSHFPLYSANKLFFRAGNFSSNNPLRFIQRPHTLDDRRLVEQEHQAVSQIPHILGKRDGG